MLEKHKESPELLPTSQVGYFAGKPLESAVYSILCYNQGFTSAISDIF